MNDDNPQKLKPIYIHDSNNLSVDEINLTDLVLVLIRHKVMIMIIFLTFISSAVIYALLVPKTYTYSTSIEIGSQMINGAIKPFESTHTLLAKLTHNYTPLVLSEHQQSTPEDESNYEILSKIPSNSNITLLEIKGTESDSDILKKLLERISQKAIQDHTRTYQSIKSSLEVRIKQKTADLEFLKESRNNETEIVTNRIHIERLSTQLANLRNTKQVQPPIRSIEPTGMSKKISVVIFSIAGIFIGVFAAFFAEFIAKVKEEKNKVTRQ